MKKRACFAHVPVHRWLLLQRARVQDIESLIVLSEHQRYASASAAFAEAKRLEPLRDVLLVVDVYVPAAERTL